MTMLEIARRFAETKQTKKAQEAYTLFLKTEKSKTPEEELEAASYIFFSRGDYQISYTIFVSLYNRGLFQQAIMDIMYQAFYLPNVEKQRKRYTENLRLLKGYSYCFQKNFPDFEDLPLLFFPFNDKGYLPFDREKNSFGEYTNFKEEIMDRYFFRDLENPILAKDVFSQYQLEYLVDNVRRSEWVGRENHIYLHYSSVETLCAYLPCLSLKKILREKKIVFLFGDEINLYPIDFKERFGIDYSQYPVKPFGIREINRLIWHTQLSTHNGGDFFNEIFYEHPNLLSFESVMLENIRKIIRELQSDFRSSALNASLIRELTGISKPTPKDFLVALFLNNETMHRGLDLHSRIVPALFFQPHFSNVKFTLRTDEKKAAALLESNQLEEIGRSPIFNQFKYIKTFTPMRRITTSYGATIRFMNNEIKNEQEKALKIPEKKDRTYCTMQDEFTERLLSRGYIVDPTSKLFKDSILVRFEDGKLNPKATFTALAEFLDLPYTESMTHCSSFRGDGISSFAENDQGFELGAVYRTYDEYTNDADRAMIEFFFRDAYQKYGYDFHYYTGELVDKKWIEKKLSEMKNLDALISDSIQFALQHAFMDDDMEENKAKSFASSNTKQTMQKYQENRMKVMEILLAGLFFVNKDGQPLQMMKPLKLDPALLEQPLYH